MKVYDPNFPVVKRFPNDMNRLESLFLIYINDIPKFEWESRYILLLWLSLVVMNPFPIKSVDTKKFNIDLASKMIEVAKEALVDPGKIRDGASIFLSRLFIR